MIRETSAPDVDDPMRYESGGYDESTGYDEPRSQHDSEPPGDGVIWCAHLWPHHAVVVDPSALIHPAAIVGSPPQSPSRPRATGPVIIGAGTVVREFASVDRPMREPRGETRVGRNVYAMSGCHLSHDTITEDHAVISAYATTSGYTRVMHHATLGLRSCTHQHVIVGPYAFVGLGAVVIEDVPPYVVVIGNPARYHGINRVGLERDGWTGAQVDDLAALIDRARRYDPDAQITLLADNNVRAFADAREARGPKRKLLPGWEFMR